MPNIVNIFKSKLHEKRKHSKEANIWTFLVCFVRVDRILRNMV